MSVISTEAAQACRPAALWLITIAGCKDAYRRNFWFRWRQNATAKLREASFNAVVHPCTAVPVSEASIDRDLIADDHQDNPDCDCHVGQYAAA
jgi:hypothetical protein